jgi:tetraacyldisaccharide 4'-kinase
VSRWLERQWQAFTPLAVALYPFSVLFRMIVASRRALYRSALLPIDRLPVPVIVVGNITAGGTGKTPLVLWLASFLTRNGMRPGIVSRGYGASAREPRGVTAASEPARVGDEPLLLAQRSDCPVWVGADRLAAARALLAAHPDRDVIVSDDGLQHYRLVRDVEIAVIDGARGLGNGLLLPAGPLREPVSRLREVDAVVIHGAPRRINVKKNAVGMQLEGREFRNLLNPGHIVGPEYFQRRRTYAVAGIGHPPRFFAHLEALGIAFEARAFPDHHAYTAADLAFANADAVVMTEKDAVKCTSFAREIHWALRVDAVPDPKLGELVLSKLRKR